MGITSSMFGSEEFPIASVAALGSVLARNLRQKDRLCSANVPASWLANRHAGIRFEDRPEVPADGSVAVKKIGRHRTFGGAH